MEREVARGGCRWRHHRLKEQDGSYLLVYAGGEFVGTLIKADLIDEYHLIMHPVVLGSGKRLFPESLGKELKLRSVKPTSTGATVLILEPAPRKPFMIIGSVRLIMSALRWRAWVNFSLKT